MLFHIKIKILNLFGSLFSQIINEIWQINEFLVVALLNEIDYP